MRSFNRTLTFLIILVVFGTTSGCKIVKKESALSERRKLENSYLYMNGLHLKMLGRTAESVEIFKRISTSDPQHSASRYELARIYTENRDFESALNYAKQAVKIDGKNKWYRMLILDIYDRKGDHKLKVPIYQQLIKEYPQDMSLYYGLANTYMQLNNLNAAIGVLNDIESLIGVTEEVSIQKYQFYIMTSKNAAAIEELKKLSRIFPGETAYTMAIGDYYLQTGNYYEALTHYSAVFEADQQNYEALISMAECYMRIGNLPRATELFAVLFRDASVDVDAKMNIVMYYYEVSQNDSSLISQAYQLLDLYMNTHPDEARVYSVYGDFLFRDGKFDEAAQQWEKVVQMDPSKYPVWEHLFMCYDMLKNYDTLAKTALRSIEYFPEQPGSYFYAGYAHYMQKQYDLSISHFIEASENAVSNNTIRVQALGYLAEAYYHLREYDLSDQAYESLLEIDPKNNWALNNYSYYLSLRGVNLEKALLMSEKTLKSNPKSASYLDTYGWILYKMERYTEAEDYLKRAVEYSLEPSAVILQNYGDVLFKLGMHDESVRYWKLAIEAGGNKEELKNRIEQISNE